VPSGIARHYPLAPPWRDIQVLGNSAPDAQAPSRTWLTLGDFAESTMNGREKQTAGELFGPAQPQAVV
jgi:hypothetical protein